MKSLILTTVIAFSIFISPQPTLDLIFHISDALQNEVLDKKLVNSQLKVSYDFIVKLDDKIKSFPPEMQKLIKDKMGEDLKFELLYSNGKSLYHLQEEIAIASTTNQQETTEKRTRTKHNFSFGYSNYHKDFESKKLLEQKSFQKNTYLIDRTLESFDWVINKEVVEISGYKCKMAHTTNNGITVKAWYTEEIAINDGPLLYHGLPGLILKIETPDREISATKIEFVNDLIVEKPTEGIKKTEKEMDAILTEYRNREGSEKKDGNKTEKVQIIRSN